MKKAIVLLLAFALAIALAASGLALGMVYTTGKVNLREGPGLGYAKRGAVGKNVLLDYLGETVTDERGVDWYKVDRDGDALWVSSKYAWLEYEPGEPDGDAPTDIEFDPAEVPNYTEVIPWYGHPLEDAAQALDAGEYVYNEYSEIPNQYRNSALRIGGWEIVEFIELTGQGYTLYGAHPGMDVETAKQKLDDAGLRFFSEDWCVCYEHLMDETSFVDFEGDADYNVLLMTNDDGIVTEISLSTYTG